MSERCSHSCCSCTIDGYPCCECGHQPNQEEVDEMRRLEEAEENEKREFLAEERKAHEQICGVNHRTVDKLRACEERYWRRQNREYHAANPE